MFESKPISFYDRPDNSNVDYSILLDAIPSDERGIAVSGLKRSRVSAKPMDDIEAGIQEWEQLREARIEEVYRHADYADDIDPYADA